VNRTNILLTTIGRRTYLVRYFQKALNGNGNVYVTNSSSLVPAFEIADKAFLSPLTYDEGYVPFLKRICLEYNINAIVPVFDLELPILARHRKEFEDIGTKIVVSGENTVLTCNDKWLSFKFLDGAGIGTPRTFLDINAVKAAISNGEISYPIMIKPRWGMGTMSTYEACDEQELELLNKKVKREIFDSYLKYESSQDKEECVIFQEKLSGQEYGLDIICDLNGIFRNTIVKKKYEMRANETDCAITVRDEALEDIGKCIAKSFGDMQGPMDVDVIRCGEKDYVLDLNARFGGGYPFSHIAGADVPQAIINWLRGEAVEDNLITAQEGVAARKEIGIVKINI